VAWFYLTIAGVFEITLTICMKSANGFKNLWPTIGTFASAGGGFLFLGLAIKSIPMGTAYATWTGIGIVGTAITGILWFGEAATWPRLLCLVLILSGIVGLKLLPTN
jgi:quaternary ammonium compound-resistance protein SugE